MKWIIKNIDWIAILTVIGAIISTISYASVTYSDVQGLKNEVYGANPGDSIRSCMARSEQKIDDIAENVREIKNQVVK